MAKNSHLTQDERITIAVGLTNALSRAAIARSVGKDRSTIAKEIKKHRRKFLSKTNCTNGVRPVFDCSRMEDCGFKNVCRNPCDKYVMQPCLRRDKKVGVCNGCEKQRRCKRVQYLYDASWAQKAYETQRSDSRQGVNLTTSQAKEIGDIVKPLIERGQSLYAIVKAHPELGICEKTLYNYITSGVFSINGLIDLDLRMKTSRKKMKKDIRSKPRKNRAYLKGRTYSCYETYRIEHPNASVVEMDTVYNDVSNGPFIQTFQFVEYDIMIAFLHKEKTAEAMVSGVRQLKERLGDCFDEMVNIIKTDRGSEFVNAEAMEKLGCQVFYCDPMCSSQKPHVENNHIMLRWILPKKTDLTKLGLRTQEDLDLIFSHINSYPRESLRGKSAIDLLMFYKGEQVLEKFHLKKIPNDEILLRPALIKKN